jgi:methylated-DNA-[protein]-cysteine S-methyltransferase
VTVAAMTPGLNYTYFDSPVGCLLLAGDGDSLHYLSFPGGHKAFGPSKEWIANDRGFDTVKRQLDAYFDGILTHFALRLTLNGTGFQKTVWRLLAEIPFGETRTYG